MPHGPLNIMKRMFGNLFLLWLYYHFFVEFYIIISMISSSNGNIFRVTGPLWGKPQVTGGFPLKSPAMRSFDVFLDLCRNIRLIKQSRRQWFGTPSPSLGRHFNVIFFRATSSAMRYYCDCSHDDVIKWNNIPRYWLFVRGIHRRWLPRTKASDAELWCFLWSASE